MESLLAWLQTQVLQLYPFVLAVILALVIGQFTPRLVRWGIHRLSPQQVSDIYDRLVEPLRFAFQLAGTLIFLALSLTWLQSYPSLYGVLQPTLDLLMIVALAWLLARVMRRFLRIYGVDLLQKLNRDVDDLTVVIQTGGDILIGFVAALAAAQKLNFNLIGLLASLGLLGLAVAFGARQILEQLVATVVLYLDRPFVTGDYIRTSSGQMGRVESIGLRSTRLRIPGKSTLYVVPNSKLVESRIENLTLAKKVMVLLYMDFERPLRQQDGALVKQVVQQSTQSLFGIDPGSTTITLLPNAQDLIQRARISFFILGSGENSIDLRKRLLELANQNISKQLAHYGIQYQMPEPTIYVESPVTL